MTFTFRPLRLPDDEKILLDLLLLGFPELAGTVAGTLEHVRWKFSRSTQHDLCLVGFDGERAVSFYGVIPQTYKIDGKERQIGLVVDVMSHPEVRRQGLFELTGRAAMHNLAARPIEGVEGFPIRDDVMPGHLKVGWAVGFPLPVYVLPTGWRPATFDGAPRWLAAFALCGLAYRSLTKPLRRHNLGTTRRLTVEQFVGDSAAQRLSTLQRGSRLVRSADFMRWRLSRPGAEYACLVCESQHAEGYAIMRNLPLRGIPTAVVLDMVVTGKQGIRMMADALVEYARGERLTTIAMCANPAHAKQLRLGRVGFLRAPMKFTLIHRSTSEQPVSMWFQDESKWQMSWIDSDTT